MAILLSVFQTLLENSSIKSSVNISIPFSLATLVLVLVEIYQDNILISFRNNKSGCGFNEVFERDTMFIVSNAIHQYSPFFFID